MGNRRTPTQEGLEVLSFLRVDVESGEAAVVGEGWEGGLVFVRLPGRSTVTQFVSEATSSVAIPPSACPRAA